MLEMESEMLSIPDIRSYNLYYGWYLGDDVAKNVTKPESIQKQMEAMPVTVVLAVVMLEVLPVRKYKKSDLLKM